MKVIRRPANDNVEYENKKEFVRLAAIVWPDKKTFRWDRQHQTLDNFLWYFKFEIKFREAEARMRRSSIVAV